MIVHGAQMFCKFSANYDVRDSVHKLALPKPRIEHLRRSFSYSVPAFWNYLRQGLRECNSLVVFKEKLTSYYSRLSSHTTTI